MTTVLNKADPSWHVIFLGNANAHLGGHLTTSVENQAREIFRDWLLEHALHMPSTFDACHRGDHHHTFVTPDGQHRARIDHVALMKDFHYDGVTTWVDDTIDVAINRIDHHPLFCQLSWTHWHPRHRRQPGERRRIHTEDFVAKMQDQDQRHHFHAQLAAPPWSLDTHRSADHLAQQT